MKRVRVYVEGGGDTRDQQHRLKISMVLWIEAALPAGSRRPTVVACGGRGTAFDEYTTALAANPGDTCFLLVDSEAAVTIASRWQHVGERRGDRWVKPTGVDEHSLQFMVQTMEAWICADALALEKWFGPGFKAAKLPARPNLEAEPKADLFAKLTSASRDSKRGAYHKGRDLGVLAEVQPAKVIARCPHAGIFLEALKTALAEATNA